MAKVPGSFQCSEIKNIVQLAQPSVSHHIKTLIEAELIEPEKDGRNHSYNLNRNIFDAYISAIAEMAKK